MPDNGNMAILPPNATVNIQSTWQPIGAVVARVVAKAAGGVK